MKIAFINILLSAFLVTGAGCKTSKPDQEKLSQDESLFITGKVTAIQPGKDGYTAKILTVNNQEYFATISRANLTDPATYRTVTIGEVLKVKGDQWQMENQNHITVRELK
ncbi:hypothetical protein [Adhaeribacter terreus]|uniref:DUF3221 domain-containing protein n=1 Tax=Adhaeribacter terreus TaxID=529703 RepID=A0ABW0E6N7_9BACT